MKSASRRWLLVTTSSLTIGAGIAITERIISKSIDYFLPKSEIIASFIRPGSITILSTNNNIIQKLGPATRDKVPQGRMPPLLKQAFVAAEDRRFYSHKGVDLWGIGRALITNLSKGKVSQGGSTITQQLARTVFLSQDRTFSRKLKEAAMAYKLEREMSKTEILEQYLNHVYLGSGAYGVADASWVFFRKTPHLLNLEEIALIAGLPPAPSFYSPLVNPDLSIKRRSIVLNKMLKEGFISEKEFQLALKKPLTLRPGTPKYFSSKAPFFTSWVNQKLPVLLTPEQLEIGGLQIKTSLNLKWQKEAQRVIRQQVPEGMEGALVSIEPSTGLVRAMVGGKNFDVTQFNRATQALRSPGSTFKIFPYAAALKKGIKPEDKFIDTPRCWSGYCPKNFGNKYLGKVSLEDAFTYSLNTVAVELLEKSGFNEVISIAKKLGTSQNRELGKYYPLAIGAYEQTLIEITNAYSTITNQGLYIEPTPFEEIRGPQNILLWKHDLNHPKGMPALKKEVANTLNKMLVKAVSKGTGNAAALDDRQVAGKTGTSEKGRDLWFIGSIPQLSTGIWFGYDNNKETKSGSGEAAWAWKLYMDKIKNQFSILSFTEKDDYSKNN